MGQLTKTYDYDAYGVEKNLDPADANPFRYCAEYFDQETQNIYLRNRYYNPSNGRFITEDPAQDGLNWYVYCGNNPLKYKDPSGTENETDRDEFGESSDTYLALVDLGIRWWFAHDEGDVEGMQQLENLANVIRGLARDGTPVQYAPWKVYSQLQANAEEAFQYISNIETLAQYDPNINVFALSSQFLITKACGEWDYKYNGNWQVPYDEFMGMDMNQDNRKNWVGWMYFDGMLMAADDFGNLNMAYVGYSMGLPDWVYMNSTTMDGKDAMWVEHGRNMAEQGR